MAGRLSRVPFCLLALCLPCRGWWRLIRERWRGQSSGTRRRPLAACRLLPRRKRKRWRRCGRSGRGSGGRRWRRSELLPGSRSRMHRAGRWVGGWLGGWVAGRLLAREGGQRYWAYSTREAHAARPAAIKRAQLASQPVLWLFATTALQQVPAIGLALRTGLLGVNVQV